MHNLYKNQLLSMLKVKAVILFCIIFFTFQNNVIMEWFFALGGLNATTVREGTYGILLHFVLPVVFPNDESK